ncbi:MAG: hypothetical protein K2K70_10540, partial [Lachnospiraceae bacterium]|nr:hypothetical protein [Lachnospiraceae bacterium]
DENTGMNYTSKELVQICGNMLSLLNEKYEEVLQENKELKSNQPKQKRSLMERVKGKLSVFFV